MANEKWERHNAANGEHIWAGDKHIADIVTDTDNPGFDENVNEIAESAILMHNDPKYKSTQDIYEALKILHKLCLNQLPAYGQTITYMQVDQALSKANVK